MAKKKKKQTRAEPVSYLCSMEAYETLCCSGYTSLADNPEIMAGVGKICDLISSMTIYLMGNTENGDVRIRNELAKKIDIHPNRYMTRKTFISAVVRTLLLEGEGNSMVFPVTKDGYLEDLVPARPGSVSFLPDGYGYRILYEGQEYDPDGVLHFVINPDPS